MPCKKCLVNERALTQLLEIREVMIIKEIFDIAKARGYDKLSITTIFQPMKGDKDRYFFEATWIQSGVYSNVKAETLEELELLITGVTPDDLDLL